MKLGNIVTITPDGPRGPKEKVKGNIIAIALKFNVPILPVAYSVSRCKRLKGWDYFMVPLPFGKGVFGYGRSISVGNNSNKNDLIN